MASSANNAAEGLLFGVQRIWNVKEVHGKEGKKGRNATMSTDVGFITAWVDTHIHTCINACRHIYTYTHTHTKALGREVEAAH